MWWYTCKPGYDRTATKAVVVLRFMFIFPSLSLLVSLHFFSYYFYIQAIATRVSHWWVI